MSLDILLLLHTYYVCRLPSFYVVKYFRSLIEQKNVKLLFFRFAGLLIFFVTLELIKWSVYFYKHRFCAGQKGDFHRKVKILSTLGYKYDNSPCLFK